MSIESAKFESGHVYLPNRAPWLAELEPELFAFPNARHDDQVDSISQALAHEPFPRWISTRESNLKAASVQLGQMLRDGRVPDCEVAWNKDPALGLICIQSGPRS